MTDSEIESFIRAFEEAPYEVGVDPRPAPHHGPLVPRRHDRDEATRLIRDGIQRYNRAQGNHTGYHETITKAWIAVIEGFLSKRDRTLPDSVLAEELLHECGDKDYLLRFYTKERLLSDEARSRWVDPDLARIEQLDLPGWPEGCHRGQGEHPGETRPLPRSLEPQGRGRVERAARQAGKTSGRVHLAKHDHEDELFQVIKGNSGWSSRTGTSGWRRVSS